jgi:hypothetical protein
MLTTLSSFQSTRTNSDDDGKLYLHLCGPFRLSKGFKVVLSNMVRARHSLPHGSRPARGPGFAATPRSGRHGSSSCRTELCYDTRGRPRIELRQVVASGNLRNRNLPKRIAQDVIRTRRTDDGSHPRVRHHDMSGHSAMARVLTGWPLPRRNHGKGHPVRCCELIGRASGHDYARLLR